MLYDFLNLNEGFDQDSRCLIKFDTCSSTQFEIRFQRIYPLTRRVWDV